MNVAFIAEVESVMAGEGMSGTSGGGGGGGGRGGEMVDGEA